MIKPQEDTHLVENFHSYQASTYCLKSLFSNQNKCQLLKMRC